MKYFSFILLVALAFTGLRSQAQQLPRMDHGSIFRLSDLNAPYFRWRIDYPNIDRRREKDSDCFVISTSQTPIEIAGFVKMAYNLSVNESFNYLLDSNDDSVRTTSVEFYRHQLGIIGVRRIENTPLTYVTGFQIDINSPHDTIANGFKHYFPGQQSMEVYVQFIRNCSSFVKGKPINPLAMQ